MEYCGTGDHGGWTINSATRSRDAGVAFSTIVTQPAVVPCCPEDFGTRPDGLYFELSYEDLGWGCGETTDFLKVENCEDLFNKMNASYEERARQEEGKADNSPSITWGGEVSNSEQPHGCIRVYSDMWNSVMYHNTAEDGVYEKPDCNHCRTTMVCEPTATEEPVATVKPSMCDVESNHGSKCGPASSIFGADKDVKCNGSRCCSKYGYCGTTADHCKTNDNSIYSAGHCPHDADPTMFPTPKPTDMPKKIKFDFRIYLTQAEVTEHTYEISQSIASLLGMQTYDVSLNIIPEDTIRRMLSTASRTDIEVRLYSITDADATMALINDPMFSTNLAQEIMDKTGLTDVSLCCVSDPVVVTSFTTPSDNDDNADVPVTAIVLPLLFCCCCAGGIFYLFQNQRKKWEVENQDKDVHGEQTGV